MTSEQLLTVQQLVVQFRQSRHATLTAVDSVSLRVGERETLGLVGESGSGKSTIGRAILGLTPISSGSVHFDGREISALKSRDRRGLSKDLQVVFQDPYESLNPALTVGQSLAETVRPHPEWRDRGPARITELLDRVGLPSRSAAMYPNEFSGGQRQRIAIARALMVNPRVVICDEAVSALDLSIQGQVLNLLAELQADLGVSYLFISHDLTVVRHMSRRIVVLYKGQVMEAGAAADVYQTPRHPYTRMLLDAAPLPDPEQQKLRAKARGRLRAADSSASTTGCPFAGRCVYATDLCREERPTLEDSDEREIACHYWRNLPAYEALAADSTPISEKKETTIQ